MGIRNSGLCKKIGTSFWFNRYLKELGTPTFHYCAFPFIISLILQIYNGNDLFVLIEPRFQDGWVLENGKQADSQFLSRAHFQQSLNFLPFPPSSGCREIFQLPIPIYQTTTEVKTSILFFRDSVSQLLSW